MHHEGSLSGREHCGLDDARNIARLAIRLMQDGCQLRINERLRIKGPHRNQGDPSRTVHQRDAPTLSDPICSDDEGSTDDADGLERTDTPPSPAPAHLTARERELVQLGVTLPKKTPPPPPPAPSNPNPQRVRMKYKVVPVTRYEFEVDAYLQCDTCSDSDSDD